MDPAELFYGFAFFVFCSERLILLIVKEFGVI